MKPIMPLGRRRLLAGLTVGLGAGMVPFRGLFAAPESGHRFVGVFFAGGWDVLLTTDCRDPARASEFEGIDLGTSLLPAAYRDPFPVHVGGQETLWGTPMRAIEEHADVATVFRGVNMNTVAHPNGRVYANTLVEPAGQSPRGDSFGVQMSALNSGLVVPSVSIGVPSFNLNYGPSLSALSVRDGAEVYRVIRPRARAFEPGAGALLDNLRRDTGSCLGAAYEGDRLDENYISSRAQLETLRERNLAEAFNLNSSGNAALRSRYGAQEGSMNHMMGDPGALAATTFQAIESELTANVVVQLVRNVDQHANYADSHPQLLERGFNALGMLLSDLRESDPSFERTTVVVFSEFARTPLINGSLGRDHWFANSFLVFGGGLRRGVFGETVEQTLGLAKVDLDSGRASDSGMVVRPEHLGATLATAAGLDPGPFRAETLDAWIGDAG